MTTFSESDFIYLDEAEIKSDPWIQAVKEAKTPEKLADLFLERIQHPMTTGPQFQASDEQETNTQIIIDMVSYSNVGYEPFEKAMVHILKQVNEGEVRLNIAEMEDVFDILWNLCPLEVSPHLYAWLRAHESYMHSIPIETKMYLAGLRTYACIQAGDEGALDMWQKLWEKGDKDSVDIAFWGLRYLDIPFALSELPRLVERNCKEAPQLIQSLFNISLSNHTETINATIKQAFADNDAWFGKAINIACRGLELDGKRRIVEKMHQAIKKPLEDVEASSTP